MKQLIIILVLLNAAFGYGQSGQNNASSTSISSNFSPISVKVYQESAALKVADYYNYLELLSSKSSSTELKAEVKKALFSLIDKSTNVTDFTSEQGNSTSLSNLLINIENKNYTFALTEFESNNLLNNSWTINYHILITQNDKIEGKNFNQVVHFNSVVKEFGNSKKKIWAIKLGEVENTLK